MSPPSPTSTDADRGRARFRRTLLITVVVLAVISAGLGAASILQGPKLRGWNLDTAAATAGPGQQLRVVLNEVVAPIGATRVSITPRIPVTVQSQNNITTIRLQRALDNATRYRVELRDVRSTRGGPASTVRVEFTTPALRLTYLSRGTTTDRIMTTTVGHGPRLLWSAPGIQSFTRVSGALVIATTTDDRQSALTLVQPGKTLTETFALPEPGRIDELTSIGNRVLFTLSSQDADGGTYYHTLFLIDLEGSHTPAPVQGIGGQPLAIDDLEPVAGSTALLLHGIDGSVVRYDPLATPAVTPVGSFQLLGGLSPDQRRLGVNDAGGPLTLDLRSGRSTRVPAPIIDGRTGYPELSTPLTAISAIVLTSLSPAVAGRLPTSELVETSPSGSRLIFTPAGTAPMIMGYRLTSNGQYLIVETNPDELHYDPDDSPVNFQPRAVTTVIVDVARGVAVQQFAGFDAR